MAKYKKLLKSNYSYLNNKIYHMGKGSSKLNVKAQYCCSNKNFEQQLANNTKK